MQICLPLFTCLRYRLLCLIMHIIRTVSSFQILVKVIHVRLRLQFQVSHFGSGDQKFRTHNLSLLGLFLSIKCVVMYYLWNDQLPIMFYNPGPSWHHVISMHCCFIVDSTQPVNLQVFIFFTGNRLLIFKIGY